MAAKTRRRILAGRVAAIAAIGGPALTRMVWIAATSSGEVRTHRLAAETARLLERLGGAFIKAGQLLATRVDLVGEPVAAALGRLHDDVAPPTGPAALRAVRAGLGPLPDGFAAAFTRPPVAGGSIAVVYRAEYRGRAVAVKVRRPGVGDTIAGDIAILRRLARAASGLPALRRVPVGEITGQLGDLLVRQLDFRAEAECLRRLHDVFADTPGVVVPDIVPELCGDGVITMEFVEGLDRARAGALPPEYRRAQTTELTRAVYRMLFVEGLVHVDLHQGNVYFMPDGRVVLLDAGLVFQMSGQARRKFTEFFGGMVRGDGEACAGVLLSTVRGPARDADVAAFRERVAELVVRNAGLTAGSFSLSAFCVELFDLQRRHRLLAEPEFAFPMLCLLTLEGTVRRNHPSMDFQLEAAPYAMQGLLAMDGDPDHEDPDHEDAPAFF
ncbi:MULTISPECIES: ABC1 kinase family protein [Thermomonosporaceae]|uniref:ABC1 kinase family protein n=1 Tax=Thermomonosporaceae TaxID=2012 RepID=UPI00255B284F|nr:MULTISPECIES: AarF/UbiB family protein [Thermomonosporaceae]MDL4776720.1 AarF/UbiB family protein [Actinomadura xylanilytica]